MTAAGDVGIMAGAGKPRLEYLDQLRGYALFGMILVNYLGHFERVPGIFHHQRDNFSYADTIWPLFMFVVGIGFRMSLCRRVEKVGRAQAYYAAAKRYALIAFVGMVFYGPAAYIDWWDALVVIGLSGLLCLPFVDRGAWLRLAVACVYLIAFTVTFLYTEYGTWVYRWSMNGGPLGVLPFAFIGLMGTLAWDMTVRWALPKTIAWSVAIGFAFVAAGYLLRPLYPDHFYILGTYGEYWSFSKRWCNAPFVFLATGCSWLAFALFYFMGEKLRLRVPTFSTVGKNALVLYLLQYSLLSIHGPYQSARASFPMALLGFAAMYAFLYATARWLERQQIIVKL